ncbi:MAG: polysaccharide deacetylase family protein [Thermoleophilaceae bacterium]|nr:polysaccharide deacetylase family protein [Thermoleophilaceae bacterium]
MQEPFITLESGRLASRLTAAAAALAAGVVLAITGTGASASGNVSLTFKQSVASAHFKAIGLEELANESGYTKLCWNIQARAGEPNVWCVTRARQSAAWKLTGKRKGVKVRIDRNSALLAVDPQLAGLTPGRYKWNLAITPCQGAPTSATGATAATPPVGCAVKYPKSGGQNIRIRSLQPVGCKIKGASQVTRGPRGKKIALTFDDGPAPGTTQFLRKLESLKVRATFFMVGQQVAGNSALLKRMLREGHELANHSWDHSDLGGGGGAATRQITRTNRSIVRASGFRPCVMRPPYGSTSRSLVSRVRAQHMTSILWDVDPQDWRSPGTGVIVNTIRGQTRGGSIILEHDGGGPRGQTLAALPQYVRTLKARGYEFVTVSELLGYRTTFKLADD